MKHLTTCTHCEQPLEVHLQPEMVMHKESQPERFKLSEWTCDYCCKMETEKGWTRSHWQMKRVVESFAKQGLSARHILTELYDSDILPMLEGERGP